MSQNRTNRELKVRERLIECGAKQLSDVELLSIFISSGSAKRSCVELAQDLLDQIGDLRQILHADLSTFKRVHGLGMVRYAQLQAVREICRRSDYIHLKKETQITTAEQASVFIKRQLRDRLDETFVALLLDAQNRVLAYEELFRGSIHSTAIYIRPLVNLALKHNAAAMIVAHNHPSGQCAPSQEDIEVTQTMKQALALVDVQLLEHIIVGDNRIYLINKKSELSCF